MKILLVSLSNIGDAVMTTPVLERLHQLYPDAVIDIVGDQRSSIIFSHCPYRGEIFHKEKSKGWRGILQLVGQLRKTRYDLIVDLRTDGLAWLLRTGKRLVKWKRKPYGPHAVQDLMSIIDPINQDRIIPPTEIWLSDTEQAAANDLLQSLPGQRWLAIGPGANWEGKVWPSERFAEAANALHELLDGVVLLGGPADSNRTQSVAQRLTLPYIDLTGKTDLLTACAVMTRCALFIGNDSGLGHLASGVGTPTITVFGPGEPERYHPWGAASRWIVGENQSLENVTVENVTQIMQEVLAP